MSVTYTREQVIALAPDAASVKAAQKLLSPAKWPLLEGDGLALWGECKGSGKKPYLVQIDRGEPAFKCSCPSRKFPCKHGLALLLLHAEEASRFVEAEAPPRVTEWRSARAERAEKKAARAEKKKETPPDPEKVARQQARRREEMEAGLADFELWMQDLIRQGLAAAQGREPSYWSEPAARLVDAKAPGMAAWVRRMQRTVGVGDDWPRRLLALLGRAYLLRRAFARFESLSLERQADVRAALGWPVDKEEVLAGEAVRERMRVLGLSVAQREGLREQRLWLQGETSGRQAMVLDFAHGQRPFDIQLAPGTTVDLELAYYPSAAPLRALVKARHGEAETTESTQKSMHSVEGWGAGLEKVSRRLALNPWMGCQPLALHGVHLVLTGDRWLLEDGVGRAVPVASGFEYGWRLAAVAAGGALQVFGEWHGESFLPLSATGEDGFLSLPSEDVA